MNWNIHENRLVSGAYTIALMGNGDWKAVLQKSMSLEQIHRGDLESCLRLCRLDSILRCASVAEPRLTMRQLEFLAVIVDIERETGRFPPIREIALALKIASPNGVVCHLKALQKRGYVTNKPNSQREAWRLVS